MTPEFRAYIQNGDDDWEMVYDLAYEEYQPINDLLASTDNLMMFTGQHDSAGNKIWEGDIVRMLLLDQPAVGTEHAVTFDPNLSAFVLIPKRALHYECRPDLEHRRALAGHRLLIVGNIHENPELLQGNRS